MKYKEMLFLTHSSIRVNHRTKNNRVKKKKSCQFERSYVTKTESEKEKKRRRKRARERGRARSIEALHDYSAAES